MVLQCCCRMLSVVLYTRPSRAFHSAYGALSSFFPTVFMGVSTFRVEGLEVLHTLVHMGGAGF